MGYTVISVNTARSCIRFHGDDTCVLFLAHERKDMEGINKDNILAVLDSSQVVMHDHCLISYNENFIFQNIECNQHLLRDLKKNTDNTMPKTQRWSKQLQELISETIHNRNQQEHIRDCGSGFTQEYIDDFRSKVNKLLLQGKEENQKLPESFWYRSKELTVINRIQKYFENYFMWLGDFSLPVTNNLSERSLRGIKVKLKISGQFKISNMPNTLLLCGRIWKPADEIISTSMMP